MLNFEFNAQAYKDSLQRELIPEGQYRAKIISLSCKNMNDGTVILNIEFQVTYRNLHFKEAMFLNPPSHPYFSSSNRRFGDLCVSCKVSPFDVKQDENILIGCVCGIELTHKKSKDGNAAYNSVKKFLRPDQTEMLKEFSSSTSAISSSSSNSAQQNVSGNTVSVSATDSTFPSGLAAQITPDTMGSTAIDADDPFTWFSGN